MKKILAVLEKNFKRLVRSKVSALVIFLGPFFLITIIGLAFNSSGLNNVVIGAHAKVNNTNIETLLNSIRSQDINVRMYDDGQRCINSVVDGDTNLCILFPEKIDASNKIQFHVDYSRLNLVFAVLKIISAEVQNQSSKIGEDLTKDLLSKVKITAVTMKSSSDVLDNMRRNANALGYQLTNITQQLDKMSLSMDFSKMNTTELRNQSKEGNKGVKSFKASMDSGIAKNKKQLESLDANLKSDRVLLADKKDVIMELKRNVSIVYNNLSCVDKTYIFANRNASQILDRLKQSDKKDCALLFSVMKVIDDNINDLNDIDKQMVDAQAMITSARQDLLDMERQSRLVTNQTTSGITELNAQLDDVDKTVADTKARIAQLNKSKNALKQQLGMISGKLSTNDQSFAELKGNLDGIVKNLENVSMITPDSIINPLATEIKPLQKNKTKLSYIFPGLLVLVIMFVSVLLSSTLVMKEKASKAFFRNLISPTSDFTFIFGNYLTSIIIIYVQTIILIAIGSLFFNVRLFPIIDGILISIFFIGSLFIFLGMLIGYMFKSEETTTLAGIFISCILFLFSSMVVPIESMQAAVAMIAKVNPFVLSEAVLRQVMIFEGSPFKLPLLIMMLSGYIIALAALSFYYLKFTKEKID
jgi:ABC-type multidrug transport system permease subunit